MRAETTTPLHALLVVENAPVPHDRRVWNQARSLAERGYEVSIISPSDKRSADRPSFERLEGIDIYRFKMPFGGSRKRDFVMEYGWAALAIHSRAMRIWRKKRFDVIHVANPPDIFFGLKWMFGWHGVKFVFDQHDLGPETYQSKFEDEKSGVLHKILTWLERRSYRASDAVIVTNESYRSRALSRGRVPDDNVFVVRNSPDLQLFATRPPTPELKDGYDHMVVFVGTMGFQDGVQVLLDAAHHVRLVRGRRDVLFVVIGTGDVWDELQEQHERMGLGEGVRFTGFISDEDMLDYLATADVGAAPDIDNPLNDISTMIKTMDYMAMGLPVVSFDLTESRRSAGEAAVYVDEHTGQAFGDALVDLLDDPERRAKMSSVGRERIDGPLSWNRSADQLDAAYRRALGLDVST